LPESGPQLTYIRTSDRDGMAHLLRYGASVNTSILRANRKHNFAHTHALQVFDSSAIYSMIPKNGCTTLRVSIALANGMIADKSQWEWIHLNNDSFRPNLKDLALARYRFTILRCPYGRLVSCYLDKIARRTADAVKFQGTSGISDLDRLTFRRFCDELTRPDVLESNMHWRPQIDFLVYADYDDYFCFENFAEIAGTLRNKIGLSVIDARPMAKHDSSQYKMVHATQSFADVELQYVEAMLESGFYPRPDRFYDAALFEQISSIYRSDLALYERHCPGKGLFADYATEAGETV
jgi:hypothetical protein